MKKNIITILIVAITVICFGACNKAEYLDAKPNHSLVVPKTLNELQALLDNNNYLNGRGQGNVPVSGEYLADDYYPLWTLDNTGTLDSEVRREMYAWIDVLEVPSFAKTFDWDISFKAIFYANVVLDGLENVSEKEKLDPLYPVIKGRALFHRAHAFYQLSQVFCVPFNKATAASDLGLPLKTSADVNDIPNRSSLQDTYGIILKELKEAVVILPANSAYKNRPSQTAAYALLARTYLAMHEYDSSYKYANASLNLYSVLIDYNDASLVDTIGTQGIRKAYNPEIIFSSIINTSGLLQTFTLDYYVRVDSNLYNSYADADLRKKVFYRTAPSLGGIIFKGSYEASRNRFGGIATDEIYLIRAECNARLGNKDAALNDLNSLMIKRWRQSNFIPFTAASANEALQLILRERRKELIYRGLRWTDIRRLNQEDANISITHIVDGVTHVLPPNDKRFTLLIPSDVMAFNPSWQQNPR